MWQYVDSNVDVYLHFIGMFYYAQILDWDYYIERLGNAIQKIITIPAALQAVRCAHVIVIFYGSSSHRLHY